MTKLRALGMTCGIGSMLIGARAAGFSVVGNIEWRRYYHTGTFEKNFPGAFMKLRRNLLTSAELKSIHGIDLVMGHPECGNFSNLNTSKRRSELKKMAGDIPMFIDGVADIRPRFFVMDDLPGSLAAFPIEEYNRRLPDYDLYWEWISNYNYGNTQLYRRRFFLVGSLRTENFVFRAGEFDHNGKLIDVIKDLPKKDVVGINHTHKKPSDIVFHGWRDWHLGIKTKDKMITYGQLGEHFGKFGPGSCIEYTNLKGEVHRRPGYCKIKLNHFSPTMTGGGSALHNHFREDTLLPLTMRERARIQGVPDDFIFLPLDINDYKSESAVYKQIGKFMPVQFCEYVSKQIMAHMKGKEFKKATDRRIIKANPDIDEAKQKYCSSVGYSNQKGACAACWMAETCQIRIGKRP